MLKGTKIFRETLWTGTWLTDRKIIIDDSSTSTTNFWTLATRARWFYPISFWPPCSAANLDDAAHFCTAFWRGLRSKTCDKLTEASHTVAVADSLQEAENAQEKQSPHSLGEYLYAKNRTHRTLRHCAIGDGRGLRRSSHAPHIL